MRWILYSAKILKYAMVVVWRQLYLGVLKARQAFVGCQERKWERREGVDIVIVAESRFQYIRSEVFGSDLHG
jgi:hypothetical protein